MNPYQVMGISSNPNPEVFRNDLFNAYRQGVKTKHPDKGGSKEGWLEFQAAHDILRDPVRRERFDKTGSINETKATPVRVKKFLESTIKAVVAARTSSGRTDDPVNEDIRAKILSSMRTARRQLDDRVKDAQARLQRTQELIDRFQPVGTDDSFEDIVGILLASEKKIIELEIEEYDDAKAINVEAISIFEKYKYKVGPSPEGQFNKDPTNPVTGDFVRPGMSYEEVREAVMKGDLSPNDLRRGTYRTRPGSFQVEFDRG